MALNLTDTHTHLDAEAFNLDQAQVIERALAAGITRFITIGAGDQIKSSRAALKLAENYPFIWASIGIHPHDAEKETGWDEICELAKHPRVVAIGETGLDFFRDWAEPQAQEECFRKQIELAHSLKKPLIIHSRQAGPECYKILKEMQAEKVGGVFHCFSEDAAYAEKLRELNFLVSIPGSVTFKKAHDLRTALESIPLSQIMLETDAPYLAPEPFRGKRCESSFMLETAKALAKIKGVSLEELAEQTNLNANKLFVLPSQNMA